MPSLKLFHRYFIGLIIVLLAGCSTAPKSPDLSEKQKQALWERNLPRLEAVDNWFLSGRLGLRTPQRSGSMSIEWQQQKPDFKIYLDGPFGQSIAEITGNKYQVSAKMPDGQEVYGATPESLMLQLTGWDFPISSLKYWVKGIPAPGEKAQIQLDDQGYAQKLQQYGWKVEYLRLSEYKGVQVPTRLRASSGDIQLTLVVSDWKLQ